MKVADAHRYCKEKTASSGSSFYYSFLFLKGDQRKAIQALYAFCRTLDDIVDTSESHTMAHQQLLFWEKEVELLFRNQATHPITKALLDLKEKFKWPALPFLQLLEGMRLDLQYQGYATPQDLSRYCHCVASTVGVLIVHVLGFSSEKTLLFGKVLGETLQRINILRDVGEDAARGRIYIPEATLGQFGLSPQMLLEAVHRKDLPEAMRSQLPLLFQHLTQEIEALYQQALAHLPPADVLQQAPSLFMAQLYLHLLSKIREKNYPVLSERVRLLPIHKIWIVTKTFLALHAERPARRGIHLLNPLKKGL